MPSTIGKCELFGIKHTTLLEGETFLRNKLKIAFFLNANFLIEKKTPLERMKQFWQVSYLPLQWWYYNPIFATKYYWI